MANGSDRLPQREQSEAKDLLRAVVYALSRAEAVKARCLSTSGHSSTVTPGQRRLGNRFRRCSRKNAFVLVALITVRHQI